MQTGENYNVFAVNLIEHGIRKTPKQQAPHLTEYDRIQVRISAKDGYAGTEDSQEFPAQPLCVPLIPGGRCGQVFLSLLTND